MSDLDLKFSGSEASESGVKKNTNSLDLKLKNGQFEEIKAEKVVPVEVKKPKLYKEEYFESLLDEKIKEIEEGISDYDKAASQMADEIFEEITAESGLEIDHEEELFESVGEDISEEQEDEAEVEAEDVKAEADEPPETDEEEVAEAVEEASVQSAVSQLADEIFEEIVEEAEAEENSEKIEDTSEEPAEEDEAAELGNEGSIIASANAIEEEKEADKVLGGLAHDTNKGKYDFINLCVLAVMVLFLGMTFVFMKQSLTTDDEVKFTAETVKTGEFTGYLSEKYVERMPMEKIMTQANVLMRKLFGKTELEFVVFKDNEPPDGPIDNNDIGGIAAGDSMTPDVTVTTAVTTPEATTTTPKIVQDFEVTTPKEVVSDSGIFTGRPIKTTTTKVTTTLDLPETTDETTTGKVNLIFPES